MKNLIFTVGLIVIFASCTTGLFAQNIDELNIDAKMGSIMITESYDKVNVDKDGRILIGSSNQEMSGDLKLTLSLNGKEYLYKYKFTQEGDLYKCDDKKYFYEENEMLIPSTGQMAALPYENLELAIEAFKSNQSKENAWAVWVLFAAK